MMPRYELGSSYFKIINHQYLGRFCRKNLQPQVYLKASKTAEDFVMPTSILLPSIVLERSSTSSETILPVYKNLISRFSSLSEHGQKMSMTTQQQSLAQSEIFLKTSNYC